MQHPYAEFQGTAIWETLATAMADLEENQDIELTTVRDVVGIAPGCTAVGFRFSTVNASVVGCLPRVYCGLAYWDGERR
jgi:hypothetical protein